MLNRDLCLRMAAKVQRALDCHTHDPGNPFQSAVAEIVLISRLLKKECKTFTIARRRRWLVASARVEQSLVLRLQQIQEAAEQVLNRSRTSATHVTPSLRDLYEELQQLHNEFSTVELDLKAGVISVETDEIELEGIFLGSFQIKLALADLARLAESSIFEVEALNPHPAASNSEVVHPHVQGERVCMGDATVPVTTALRAGRLADAFLAINAVLHTYNPYSAYVSLDDWDGARCGDCDNIVSEDGCYSCSTCDRTVCEDCSGCCDECLNTYCNNCLELISEPEPRYLCEHCRDRCTECEQFVASGDLHHCLCPQCLEQQQENNNERSIPNSTDAPDPGTAVCADTSQTAGTALV